MHQFWTYIHCLTLLIADLTTVHVHICGVMFHSIMSKYTTELSQKLTLSNNIYILYKYVYIFKTVFLNIITLLWHSSTLDT